MDFKLQINDFEGPLDLLLHLVKTSKVDIYEIDLKIIIDEYLEYINNLKNKNIDIASSYLIVASELIHLKSKMLVNNDTEEDLSEEFSITSEEDLRHKLIEYEKYQKLTNILESKLEKRGHYYTKSPMNLTEFIQDDSLNLNVNLEDLIASYQKFMDREKFKKPLNTSVTKREYSIEERIEDIRNILNKKKKIEFIELFEEHDKDYLIVTFLSILTMSKMQEIILMQENNFKPIIIEKV